MSYAVKVLDCHGGCSACYEADIRACNGPAKIDLDAIKKTIAALPDGERYPTIHGGEPLVLPASDLADLLKTIYSRWNQTGMQTSLHGLTRKHIELFKQNKTSIGVSIDGDTAALNQGRWNGLTDDQAKIEAYTLQTLAHMADLKKAGVSMSAIIVLRKCNAAPDRIADLIRFIERLIFDYGITSIRCNQMIAKNERSKPQELTSEELATAFRALSEIAYYSPGVEIQPFRDVVDLLMGHANGTCIFTECDPYATTAERPILPDGSIGCCLKSGLGQDGIQGLSADKYAPERYALLRNIDQKNGGCKGCRWWPVCKGGCPGEGIDNDWRNRTRFCEAMKALFEETERIIRGLMPNAVLSCDKPGAYLESQAVLRSIGGSTWRRDKSVNLSDLLAEQQKQQVDSGQKQQAAHGDIPHGDHSDSNRPTVTPVRRRA